MKKVLVTGGNGFLGSFVCQKLRDKGYLPIPFGSTEWNLLKPQEAEEAVKSGIFGGTDVDGYDAVIHLAARVGGIGANMNNPGKFAYENLMMGVNIINACKHKTFCRKLIVAGTICAYPKHTPVPFKEEDLWNGYPEETNAPYGLAKKMLLVLCQSYRAQYGCNYVYLLPVNLYGERDSFDLENSHVIPAMIRKFHEAKVNGDKCVTLWGDGTPTREFLYAGDCADAFVRAMESYESPDPMNIGSGREVSMRTLAEMILSVVGFEGTIVWDASRPNGQPRRCLDVSRAKKEIQWEATTSLEDGLAKTYQWFVENHAAAKQQGA